MALKIMVTAMVTFAFSHGHVLGNSWEWGNVKRCLELLSVLWSWSQSLLVKVMVMFWEKFGHGHGSMGECKVS